MMDFSDYPFSDEEREKIQQEYNEETKRKNVREARLRLEAEYEVYCECARKRLDGTRGLLRIKSFEEWMVQK